MWLLWISNSIVCVINRLKSSKIIWIQMRQVARAALIVLLCCFMLWDGHYDLLLYGKPMHENSHNSMNDMRIKRVNDDIIFLEWTIPISITILDWSKFFLGFQTQWNVFGMRSCQTPIKTPIAITKANLDCSCPFLGYYEALTMETNAAEL